MGKLRVGVVGVGSISRMHIQSYLKNSQVELVAFCDINEERLKEKSELYNVKNIYGDYKEMFEKEKLDAVSICTWNNFHAEVAITALKSGIHVLCEKPLSITNEQAKDVAAAAKASGKHFMVGFVRRNADNTQIIKKFVDNGDVGEIYYAKLNCFRRIGNPGGWFADKMRSGGGPVIDLGVHLIDVAWYLMGRPNPVSVSANIYKELGNFSNIQNKKFYKAADYSSEKNDVEDLANALIRFENGASMSLDVSYSLHTAKDALSVELFGTKGGARLEPACEVYTEMHNHLVDITPYVDHNTFDFDSSFQREIDNFVHLCSGKVENISPVEDGVQIMKILCGIYESAAKKMEIRL